MMKANELRIGNLIYGSASITPDMKNIHVVDMATIGIISGDVPMNGQLLFAPIPLTKEWLLKFGFSIVMSYDGIEYWEYDNFLNTGSNDTIWFGTNEFKQSEMTVHRMQNIYYALTGEELKMILS